MGAIMCMQCFRIRRLCHVQEQLKPDFILLHCGDRVALQDPFRNYVHSLMCASKKF